MFGLLVPLLLLTAWTVSLIAACCLDLSICAPIALPLGVLLRTFLHTGLFITAHDAMHGTVVIGHPRLNHFVGHLCTILYALLPYSVLRAKHRLHHQYPATNLDPDYSDQSIGYWYLQFMGSYLFGAAIPGQKRQHVWYQAIGMAILFLLLHGWAHIPLVNLLLLWVLPIILSSIQLFYFGTFLPHHTPAILGTHRARSSNLAPLWSLLTCYHFGYHWEHHEYPQLPWYKLPMVKDL